MPTNMFVDGFEVRRSLDPQTVYLVWDGFGHIKAVAK